MCRHKVMRVVKEHWTQSGERSLAGGRGHGRLHGTALLSQAWKGVCRQPRRGWGEGHAGPAAVGLMLGIRGTVVFGREDVLGSGDCDTSHIILCEYLLTLVFMEPALSKGR